jgi:hypothetical protein
MVEAQNAPASVITSDSGSAGPACHITWEQSQPVTTTFSAMSQKRPKRPRGAGACRKGVVPGYLGALLACAEHDARGGKSQSAADPSAFCAKISANLKVQCACTLHGWPAAAAAAASMRDAVAAAAAVARWATQWQPTARRTSRRQA